MTKNTGPRYEVRDTDGNAWLLTDSFAKAVAYARQSEWNVYSRELHRLIYDGYRDEFLRK